MPNYILGFWRKESTAALDSKVLELLKANIPAIRISEILVRDKSTIYRVQERLLKTGQIASLPAKDKRKTPMGAVKLKAIVKELCLAHNSPIQISKITDKSKQAIYSIIKTLIEDDELKPEETSYVKAGPPEQRKWYKIIERTLQELPFYERQGLVPTARKMGYRLIELGVLLKKDFDRFYRMTAEARKGVDSTYSRATSLPKLPIDCFRDDVRITIGNCDLDYGPTDPTPATAPEDPEEWIEGKKQRVKDAIQSVKYAIQYLRDAPSDYNGECEPGNEGKDPGYWYNQPIYCEVWCESDTIQPDLIKYQGDRKVMVAAMRGYPSTPSVYQNCKRLKEIVESHDHIEKIVILYFGDSDKAGNDIANNVESALNWYSDGSSDDLQIPVEVEFRRIAITPEQVKKYKLKGFQLEAFMTTEKLLKVFKQILQDAIDDCWDEDIYDENCPNTEYDYEANGEEEPEDIDPDNTYYNDDTEETYTEMMERKVNDALQNDFKKYVDEEDDGTGNQ